MKVALVVPIAFLEKYNNPGVQYCLPRLIVESEAYRSFFQKREKGGDYIILDIRKLGWKREPEEYNIVSKALKYLSPSIVIYPSYMYNTLKTIGEAERFLNTFNLVGAACLEGPDRQGVTHCKSQIRPVYTFAIPSHILNIEKEVQWTKPLIYIENHLSIYELESLNGILATSLPFKLGAQGRLMRDYLPSPSTLDFFSTEDPFPKITERNIKDTVKYYSQMGIE